MSIRTHAMLSLAFLFWLSSCAVVNNVEMQQTDRAKIKSIAVLRINESQNITAQNIAGAAPMLLGGPGAAIETMQNQKQAQIFASKLNENKLAMGPPLLEYMTKSLESEGYSVVYLPNEFPVQAPDGSDDFSGVKADTDAILTIWFGGTGYYSPALSLNYRPFATVGVRLIDAETKQTLYFKNFESGLNSLNPTVTSVDGCENPEYQGFDDLMSDITNAYNGIVACQELIWSQIFSDLK